MTEDEYKEWFEKASRFIPQPIKGMSENTTTDMWEKMFQAFKSRMLHEIKAQEGEI